MYFVILGVTVVLCIIANFFRGLLMRKIHIEIDDQCFFVNNVYY